MTVRVDVSPALLQWAVARAGWDEETLERRAPKFHEWVAGTRKPTLNQLEKFASGTHTPFGLLFLQKPPVEELPIPDMRTIGNQAVPQPSADLLDTIYLCQSRQDWYRSYALENGVSPMPFVGAATTATPPAEVARSIRELLGLDSRNRSDFANWEDALRKLIDRVEDVGVLVMISGVVGSNTHRPLNPEEFRGFALADPVAPLIFINGADTKAAQIFTLIHELAHIWLGGSALSDASMTAKHGKTEELWCNQVAAEVLVPIDSLRSEYVGEASVEELERLAKKYKASTLVVLKRLHDAGFLTWDHYRALYDDERARVMAIFAEKRRTKPGGNYYNTQPLRISRRFAEAVVASTFEGSTTYRDAFQLLGTKKPETFYNLAERLGAA